MTVHAVSESMPIANWRHLSAIILPLNGLSQREYDRIEAISPDDESAMREVFRQHIVPYFNRAPQEIRDGWRDSLRYFLTAGTIPISRVLDQQQESPLHTPSNPEQFFAWIWDEVFPGKSYELDSLDGWHEEKT